MKKFLCALTAALLTGVLFAGCNNGDTASSEANSGTASKDIVSSQVGGDTSDGDAANSKVPSPNSMISGLTSSVESMLNPSEASSGQPISSAQ